jgi:hypothetical protein
MSLSKMIVRGLLIDAYQLLESADPIFHGWRVIQGRCPLHLTCAEARAVYSTYQGCRRTAPGTQRYPAGSWRVFPLAISCGLVRETRCKGYLLTALLSGCQATFEYTFPVTLPASRVGERCQACWREHRGATHRFLNRRELLAGMGSVLVQVSSSLDGVPCD